MFQRSLFEDDYDVTQVRSEVRLLSDLKDVAHASSQGLVAVSSALMELDSPQFEVQEILSAIDVLHVLMESATHTQNKLITKGAYRGEKQ